MLLLKLSDKWAEATRSFVLAAWRGEMLLRSTPGVPLWGPFWFIRESLHDLGE